MGNIEPIRKAPEAEPIRLNLGAGPTPIEGYDNSWDQSQGKAAYPLKDFADGTVDELRASHILEHFSHRGAEQVMHEWVRVLKPGGLMRIAVPDFELIAQMFVSGQAGQYQGWICGGQVDPYDTHLAQYTWETLASLMRHCGLVGIHKWKGDADCSGLPISLNLAGWKRPERWERVCAALSAPRLGFLDHYGCHQDALMPLGIAVFRRSGAFWGQSLTAAIEAAIEQGAQWVLTMDYDTVFTLADVEDLMTLGLMHPHADALVPVQMKRLSNLVLMRPKGVEGHGQFRMELSEWDATLWPISMGHFGCSLIRASAFAKLAKPWFHSIPDANGEWKGQHLDEDPWFWKRFEEAGCQAFLAPRVVVGHIEEVVSWPDRNLNKIYQTMNEWHEQGKPHNCWR